MPTSGRRRAEVAPRSWGSWRSWAPAPAQVVDAALLLATCTAALLGLAPTYTGVAFAAVGVAGLVVGLVLVHVCRVLRWPVVAPVLLAAAVFYAAGGALCLRAEGATAPTPRTFGLLTDQLLFGWKDLLTTLPPVDGDGPLLVLPWVLGLAAGTLGGLLSGVSRGPVWLHAPMPLAAPLALLGAVILLGVRTPASLWVQGAAVGAGCLTWLVLRAHRTGGPVTGGSGRVSRLATGGALLALAGLAAQPVGTWAAGGDDPARVDAGRVVLRTFVEPPFDVGRYPSPLSSFRRYVEMPEPDAVNLHDALLFTVEGAPVGTRVRITTLDHYDGVVWGASNQAFPGTVDGSYRRVGSTIDNPVADRGGRPVDVRMTLAEGYSGVWLPTIGALESVHFSGADQDAFAESFRYNLDTGTGVVPAGVGAGDRYTFTAVVTDDSVTAASTPSQQVGSVGADAGMSFLDQAAAKWTEGVADPMARVFAIAEHLRTEGKYSDGVLAKEQIYRPGHFVSRLDEGFVNAPLMVGNDEQYAAVMALMANKVGVPARVVFGAVLPEGGEVHGRDVQAWVELRVADGSWRTLPTEDFMGDERPADQQTRTEQQLSGLVIPPPAQVPPPSSIDEQTDAEITPRKVRRDADDDRTADDGLPRWVRAVVLYAGGPLLALLLVAAAILTAKALRRRRRRGTGHASGRIAGAWRELVDHARDLGASVPVAGVTRREQSALISSSGAPGLARAADLRVFGPAEPPGDEAASYWTLVDAERRALSSGVSRSRRLRAALSLRSFWGR
ncbi:transglutaminase-like domain-containing protein [Nocardioides bigeumensis]|uniref:Transglutaminase-like domain-containing protein n=1 Tax=Nocardioides bigeumensis TaxID=433657 RepID=A0ABP5KBS0_9ACTN